MRLQYSVCLALSEMMTGTASHQTDCFHFGHLAKQLHQSWITFSRKHWSSLMLLLLQQTKTLIKGIQGLGRDHRHISASLTSFTTFPCWCSHKCTLNTTLHWYCHKASSYLCIVSNQQQPFCFTVFSWTGLLLSQYCSLLSQASGFNCCKMFLKIFHLKHWEMLLNHFWCHAEV